ncbi:type I methionyl aminopeptidase [Paenibacillus aceti]|uniref:Methionine aminopeptidase n=1 Tax=Paenibacillus aceti TaxID=1820010 RepID=A0ABQ1VVC9_9BACL|nr:type I methionyl aminopeptidase [Paenibacillus aceti]GGF99375.1 methionine aminopeptidase [Paenibacillus aceti]
MKVSLKSKEEIAKIREAGEILADCRAKAAELIAPGITTMEIDAFVEKYLAERGATPEQKGYRGFPFATCASVNEVVCHGFPNHTKLKEGDILTIDLVVNKKGWLADSAWTFPVGAISEEAKRLMKVTEQALYAGIEQAVPGNRIGDIGYAVGRCADKAGMGIVKALIGHGIGRKMHEAPDVPNFGRPHSGMIIKTGMVFTIEPIFTLGDSGAVLWDDDGWTIRSADGTLGAHFEHTLAVLEDGPVILTK